MNYYSLFRVRSWSNSMRCMSFYILMGTCEANNVNLPILVTQTHPIYHPVTCWVVLGDIWYRYLCNIWIGHNICNFVQFVTNNNDTSIEVLILYHCLRQYINLTSQILLLLYFSLLIITCVKRIQIIVIFIHNITNHNHYSSVELWLHFASNNLVNNCSVASSHYFDQCQFLSPLESSEQSYVTYVSKYKRFNAQKKYFKRRLKKGFICSVLYVFKSSHRIQHMCCLGSSKTALMKPMSYWQKGRLSPQFTWQDILVYLGRSLWLRFMSLKTKYDIHYLFHLIMADLKYNVSHHLV